MRFYLLRHGQTEWNVEGKIQGKTDIPLNETGFFQAECLAKGMEEKEISAIYSSPLLRARQTAEILAEKKGLPVRVLSGLREVDFGLWEGRDWEEIEAAFPEDFHRWEENPALFMPTGGETREACQRRCQLAVEQMIRETASETSEMKSDAAVAIAAHGGILAHIARYLLRNQENPGEIIVKNASISMIEYDPESELGNVLLLNDTSHLKAVRMERINKFC